ATFTTSTLSVASHTITAAYGGDGNFNQSPSTALVETVNAAPPIVTTTTVSSSVNPSVFGQPVTFIATVTSGGQTGPTGTVQFFDGAGGIGSSPLDTSGRATVTISTMAAGGHSMTAQYQGDATHSSSTSAAFAESVNRAVTTTTLASSANPSAAGQTV